MLPAKLFLKTYISEVILTQHYRKNVSIIKMKNVLNLKSVMIDVKIKFNNFANLLIFLDIIQYNKML